ncbi:MAG: hypothetical protein M0006_15965 [Magnetospirillum sp.]|nr:hypothetical protein [Magnetospirillum sp.]
MNPPYQPDYLRGPYEARFSLRSNLWEIWTPEGQQIATIGGALPLSQRWLGVGTAQYLARSAEAFRVAGAILKIEPFDLVSPNVITTLLDAAMYARVRLPLDDNLSPVHGLLQKRLAELFRAESLALLETGEEQAHTPADNRGATGEGDEAGSISSMAG